VSGAITRTTCWSARQCFERATALDTQAEHVVQQLDQLSHDVGMTCEDGTRCTEHQAAVNFIASALELVEHLVVNMKSGFALPPTPGSGLPRLPVVPGLHQRPVEQPPGYKPPAVAAAPAPAVAAAAPEPPPPPPPPAPTRRTRAAPPPRPPKPPKADGRRRSATNGRAQAQADARAQGLLHTADMLAALSLSKGGFHQARKQGRVPEPHQYRRGMPFWTAEQLAGCTTRGAPGRTAS
jgi:hypothetical protein